MVVRSVSMLPMNVLIVVIDVVMIEVVTDVMIDVVKIVMMIVVMTEEAVIETDVVMIDVMIVVVVMTVVEEMTNPAPLFLFLLYVLLTPTEIYLSRITKAVPIENYYYNSVPTRMTR